MKAAFLQCDHVRSDLQKNIGGDYDEVFKNLFKRYNESLIIDNFDLTKMNFPKDIHHYDLFISSGSQNSVYEDLPWINRFKDFVKLLNQHKKKFIGICFGHQMIAQALGGHVEKSSKGWCLGIHRFDVVHKCSWLYEQLSDFDIIMSCQDQITKLPAGSQVVASNERCDYGIIQIGEHFLGIQGHPEWTKAYSKATIKDRKDKISTADAKIALESLKQEIDQEIVFDLINRFINK